MQNVKPGYKNHSIQNVRYTNNAKKRIEILYWQTDTSFHAHLQNLSVFRYDALNAMSIAN